MTIQSFINNISPSQDEIDQISTSGGKIRDALKGKISFINDSFLTGSYIRKTKISPIDDLDIFFNVKAGNTSVNRKDNDQKTCRIRIPLDKYDTHILKNYATYKDGYYYVSPNKIMNEMKNQIKNTYASTPDITRNGECVTVYLSSYDLSIDCVPCIGVEGEEYYLIPTSGNDLYWKKTNPKIDKDEIDLLNDSTHFNGKLKGAIRVMKYRNDNKNTGVGFRSYILESIIYRSLKSCTSLYSSDYTSILKQIIKEMYNKKYHNILDIPGYDYMHYSLTDDQWTRIKGLLETMRNKLNESEDAFTNYLSS